MFVDLGIYGISHKSDFAGREGTLRRFEKFTIDKGGFQALYAETLMDYEEFNSMFSQFKKNYWKAKSQLPMSLEAFPEVYEKVSRQGRQAAKMRRMQQNLEDEEQKKHM